VILRTRAFQGTSKRIAIAITLVLGRWLHVIGSIVRENGMSSVAMLIQVPFGVCRIDGATKREMVLSRL
jgi:hypothetical protein